GRWLVGDSKRWHEDETLEAFDLSRRLCRMASARANEKQDKLASRKTAANVLALAQSDRRLAATVDQWDADPWLLNTPGGTVDLRTGALRPHRREDWITRMTAVTPGGDCPLFRAFLDRIFAGDAALIAFVRRGAGYALTAVVAVC